MKKSIKKLAIAILLTTASIAYAEGSAPVYDADSLPPFEGQPGPEGVQSSSAPAALTLRQQVERLEQQMNTLKQPESSARVSDLQKEVQALRGQVEELTHQLQQAQNQQRAMYADLENRLKQPAIKSPVADKHMAANSDTTETKPALSKTDKKTKEIAPVAKQNTTEASQPNLMEEQQIYQTAYNYIKEKKYEQAVSTLQNMLQKYPSSQFAANAHYWLGELYGLMNKNDQAATEFGVVVKKYFNSPKVSDAQLKLGMIYASQSKWADAKSAFKTVINQYPGTASARVAADQLKQIK